MMTLLLYEQDFEMRHSVGSLLQILSEQWSLSDLYKVLEIDEDCTYFKKWDC